MTVKSETTISPAQRFLLDLVQEEAAEVIKGCSKTKRFGLDGTNPATGVSNRIELQEEMTDLYRRMRECAMGLLIPWREISADGCAPKPPPEELANG